MAASGCPSRRVGSAGSRHPGPINAGSIGADGRRDVATCRGDRTCPGLSETRRVNRARFANSRVIEPVRFSATTYDISLNATVYSSTAWTRNDEGVRPCALPRPRKLHGPSLEVAMRIVWATFALLATASPTFADRLSCDSHSTNPRAGWPPASPRIRSSSPGTATGRRVARAVRHRQRHADHSGTGIETKAASGGWSSPTPRLNFASSPAGAG